jgi:uncharacterized delta-60 repeat protein
MNPRRWLRAAECPAILFVALSAIGAPQPGTIDSTFNTGRGALEVSPGTGYGAVLQNDGRIVVGGFFNGVGVIPMSPLARFNSDGSLDGTFDSSSFQVDTIGIVYYTKPLCIQADGKIFVGGNFSTSDGAHRSLLRLNTNGTLDTTFNPLIQSTDQNYPPTVNVGIVQPDGKLLISGSFATVNGVARPSLARLNMDGTLDATFVPAYGGWVIALQQDGRILTTAGDLQPIVIRLNSDGSIDSSFQSNLTNVKSLFLQSDDKIIVSEDVFFGEIFQTSRLNNDGSLDQSYTEASGVVVGIDGTDRVFVAATLSPPGFSRLNLDGTIDPTFQPCDSCGGSMVVEQPDGSLIVVGQFSEAPFGVRRLLPTGEIDSSFAVGSGLTTIFDGSITHTALLPNGKLIVIGTFTYLDTLPRNKIGRLNHDGTPDPSFDAGDSAYYDPQLLVPQLDGKVLVAIYSDLSRLEETGKVDALFHYTAPTYSNVQAIGLQRDGKIVVGYEDTCIRLNVDGTLDSSFDAGLDVGRGVSQIFVQPDGKILINGNFSSVHGVPRLGPTRLNSDGTLDESFGNTNAFAISLWTLLPNGKSLATYYSGFGGTLERLNSDGTVDQNFSVFMTSPSSLAGTMDGSYIGTNTVTRLHNDGSLDSSFAPVFASDATILELLVQVDGQVIVAGNFTEVNGMTVNGIVRLNGVSPEKVANISTRALVGTVDAVEIGGFIVTGTADKSVVVRAVGPSLEADGSRLAGVLSNPRLELHDSTGQLIAQNDDWRESQEAAIVASGLAPLDEQESAIAATLAPGAYTAVVQGNGGETGIALVEVYDTSPAADSKLQNISTRGEVETGDDVMIAGIILTGSENASIVARAIGPSLADLDVTNPLGDPILELHDQSGATIASNDNWKETQEAELTAVGLAPAREQEAALLATLPPGPYTAIVRGADETAGVGLVEFYDLR